MERRDLPPLNWLRSFEAAARRMSFTLAAEELGITQSAVSQQIKLLERFLRLDLFLRRPRSLQLTDAGRDYLPFVMQAFATLEEGTRPYLSPTDTFSLTVYVNSAFSVYWLMPRIGSFTERHPNIRLDILASFWTADYLGTDSDVEIRYGRGEWADRETLRLSRDRFYPVCAPAMADRLADPEDLRSVPRLSIRRVSDNWDRWGREAAIKGVAEPGTHQFNTYVLVYDFAERGGGVALGHETLCAGLLEQGRLVKPFDLGVPTVDNYYLAMPDASGMTEPARLFRDWIFESFAGAEGG